MKSNERKRIWTAAKTKKALLEAGAPEELVNALFTCFKDAQVESLSRYEYILQKEAAELPETERVVCINGDALRRYGETAERDFAIEVGRA